MAEIRTHDPSGGSDLGKLVREALGETIRPIEPGATPPALISADEPATLDVTSLEDTWATSVIEVGEY